jgi:excisionase family DNA binding protein
MDSERLKAGAPALRVGEFAALVGLHRDTVRKWINAGLLSAEKTGLATGERRISTAEAVRFLREMRLEPAEKSADSADSTKDPLSPVPAPVHSDERMKFAKLDKAQQLVFGLASVSALADGKPVEDSQGDQIEPAELEKAQYDYVLESRQGGTMHDEMGTATLVESFVITAEKLAAIHKALGIEADLSKFKGAATWVGYKVHDAATWAQVESGELAAFSIGGEAVREEAA